MLQFFVMIFRGFIWFASFGKNVAGFFSSFARFGVFRMAMKYFLLSTFYAFVVLLVVLSMAFFYFVIRSIVEVFNIGSMIMIYINSFSSSGDDIISALFYFLHVTGIIQGLESAYPFIASAVLFLLIKALYRVTLFIYTRIFLQLISLFAQLS